MIDPSLRFFWSSQGVHGFWGVCCVCMCLWSCLCVSTSLWHCVITYLNFLIVQYGESSTLMWPHLCVCVCLCLPICLSDVCQCVSVFCLFLSVCMFKYNSLKPHHYPLAPHNSANSPNCKEISPISMIERIVIIPSLVLHLFPATLFIIRWHDTPSSPFLGFPLHLLPLSSYWHTCTLLVPPNPYICIII